jgi:hypothetical protein
MLGLSVRFEQDPNGLTAQQVMQRWVVQHRYLPNGSTEPDLLWHLVGQFMREQQRNGVNAPRCPVHRVEMALLGEVGMGWHKTTRTLSLNEIFGLGKRGWKVHNGIFRCPTPCCFFVESPNGA